MITSLIIGSLLISNAVTGYNLLKLKESSSKDGLTNVYNRSQFVKDFHKSFKRESDPKYLILIDVDDFKSINDNNGHQYGDETLCKLAAHLVQSVRKEDRVYRIGGDEFAILVNALTPSILDRLMNYNGCKYSIGSAELGDDRQISFIKADERLYLDKNK